MPALIPEKTSRWSWATGHLEVTNIVLALPVDEVRSMLPSPLALAAQTLTPPGTHPVVLMFGQHSHVDPWFMPKMNEGYDEWIVATPFLEWRKGATVKPCSYMSRLYLNNLLMVIGGWMYGYPKKLSRSSVTPTSYDVRTFPGNQPRVSMTNAPAGPPVPFSSLPNSQAIALMFELPFIQKLSLLPWLGSRMWFEIGNASVQPMTARISVTDTCAPGLKAINQPVGSILDGFPGAFHLSCDWILSRMYLAADIPPELYERNPPH